MPATAPLLAADVPWLLYRSYFALPKSIADDEGRPVNALLGTVNALVGYIESCRPDQRPRCVLACMGAEEADYRVRLYPPYHAHRDAMPAELRWQWQRAGELLESFAWSCPSSDSLEADDVMFSYARAEQDSGGRALLMTGDRDLYGAVGERIAVLELRKGGGSGELGAADVRERYGIEPEQVADFIALRGDPSDGLPGAPGIGAKTAAELLRAHGTLENLLAAARAQENKVARGDDAIRPRAAAALRENEELLRKFREIATLQSIDVERPPDAPSDFATGAEHARKLGMKRLAERLEKLA
ncbi:MAG TPA: 5'-3' exonuclease H3TH domain-containing protein [Solirubrobacteraceae bacterium]|jgi:DNA polymerase-1|nr:5'-3' exonuclease H3TH domain-containing protein [Solirubrobacteraceae bacterium]